MKYYNQGIYASKGKIQVLESASSSQNVRLVLQFHLSSFTNGLLNHNVNSFYTEKAWSQTIVKTHQLFR